MKTVSKLLLVSALGIWGLNTASAQTASKYDRALKRTEVKDLVDSKNYVFEANHADFKSGAVPLKYHRYDVALSKDTLLANLPTKSGGVMKFDCTKYTYNEWKNKTGDRIVVIDPKTNMADIKQIRMDIRPTGYASVRVTRTDRGPLSFDGYIKQENY